MIENNSNNGARRRRRADRYLNNGGNAEEVNGVVKTPKKDNPHFTSIVEKGFPIGFINQYITNALKGYDTLRSTILNPKQAREEYLKLAKSTQLIARVMAGEKYCTLEEVQAVYFLLDNVEYDRILFDKNYHSWYAKPFNVKVCYNQCNPWIVNAILESCMGVNFVSMDQFSETNYYNFQGYSQDGIIFSYMFER